MLTLFKPGKRVLTALMALCVGPAIAAQGRGTRFPLPVAAVMTTLQRAGLSVDIAHLEMPTNMTSTSSQPSLHIAGAELLSDGRLRVRLSCEVLAECQPFFVNTAVATHETELLTLASLRSTLPSERPSKPLNRAVLKAGDQVQLFLHDERMRISMPVISIDSGTVGAEVRVSSLDHKQTFRAFVVSASLVRGVLP